MPKRGKKRVIKIIDRIIIFLIFLILVTMFFRRGETISDLSCDNCNSTLECKDLCFRTCIKKGYDSITTSSYVNESFDILCDCRCDHFLHSMVSRKKCEKPLMRFGNSCCSDLDNSTICDKYEVIDLSRIKIKEGLERLKCPESCDDKDICTRDVCSIETSFECKYIRITHCCGNNICEETETCTSCFTDCGGCFTDLKTYINESFGEQEWEEKNDSIVKDLKYHSYKNGEIIIVEILSEDNFLRSYDQFLNFNFLFPKKNETSGKIWKLNILEDKEHNIIFGKVKDKVGYWTEDNENLLFHHFNIHCAPNIYIRLQPKWTYHNLATLDSYEEYKRMNKFETDADEILPKALMLIKNCSREKKDSEIINLTEKINNVLNKNYVYTEKNDSYDNNIISYQPFNNNEIIILKLQEKIKQYDLLAFEKNRFNNSIAWINKSTKIFEDSMKNYYKLADMKFITYHKYESHELNRTIFYNNVSIEDNNIVETLYGGVYIYKITYKKLDQNSDFIGYLVKEEIKQYVTHKLSLLCQGIVVELNAENIDVTGLTKENIIPNLKNKIEENKKKLLTKANNILDACS